MTALMLRKRKMRTRKKRRRGGRNWKDSEPGRESGKGRLSEKERGNGSESDSAVMR